MLNSCLRWCFLLAASLAFQQLNAGDQSDWAGLAQIGKGERVQVVLKSMKTMKGQFESFSPEVIVLTTGGSSASLQRQDVVRVTLTGRSKRLRNMAIGMGIGALAGCVIGVASTGEGDWLRPLAIGFTTGLGIVGGAATGVAIPSHPVIYRVKAP